MGYGLCFCPRLAKGILCGVRLADDALREQSRHHGIADVECRAAHVDQRLNGNQEADEPDSVTPIAAAVDGPTRPSAVKPLLRWKRSTALRVASP